MNPSMNNPNQNDDNNVDHSETISNGRRSSRRPLTHPELLRRRLHNTRRMSRYYQDMYWLLINQLRFLLRLYILEIGLSPFQQEDQQPNIVVAQNYNRKCAFAGCEKKAMPITTFCFAHILSDPRQVLYKPCQFVISSAQSGGGGPIRCRKPIYRLTVPSYCDGHIQEEAMSNEEDTTTTGEMEMEYGAAPED